MLGNIDAMEKSRDFELAAQVAEMQLRHEALGRALSDATRLLSEEESEGNVIVGAARVLEARAELEKMVVPVPAKSILLSVDMDVKELKRAVSAVGKVTTKVS